MEIDFEAYTAAGVLKARLLARDRLGDLLETMDSLALERAVLQPLEGGAVDAQERVVVEIDDLLLVVAPPDTATPVHAAWHELVLDVGPYHLVAEMPTLPGFDPGRSLARPGGPFVLLGRVAVSLVGIPGSGELDHGFAWVNRYAVEAYEADIELGAYFPGARQTIRAEGAPA